MRRPVGSVTLCRQEPFARLGARPKVGMKGRVTARGEL